MPANSRWDLIRALKVSKKSSPRLMSFKGKTSQHFFTNKFLYPNEKSHKIYQFSRIACLTCLTCLIYCQGIKFSKCESFLRVSKILYCLLLELEELTTEHVSVFQPHHLCLQIRKLLLLPYFL